MKKCDTCGAMRSDVPGRYGCSIPDDLMSELYDEKAEEIEGKTNWNEVCWHPEGTIIVISEVGETEYKIGPWEFIGAIPRRTEITVLGPDTPRGCIKVVEELDADG